MSPNEKELLEFVELIARMKTEEEFGEDQPPFEDWIGALNELIESARELTGVSAARGGAKEDKCRFCDAHIGWIMQPGNRVAEALALNICDDCSENICEPCKDGDHDSCEDTELNKPCACPEHEAVGK